MPVSLAQSRKAYKKVYSLMGRAFTEVAAVKIMIIMIIMIITIIMIIMIIMIIIIILLH